MVKLIVKRDEKGLFLEYQGRVYEGCWLGFKEGDEVLAEVRRGPHHDCLRVHWNDCRGFDGKPGVIWINEKTL